MNMNEVLATSVETSNEEWLILTGLTLVALIILVILVRNTLKTHTCPKCCGPTRTIIEAGGDNDRTNHRTFASVVCEDCGYRERA